VAGVDANAGFVGADLGYDRIQHFERHAHAVFDAAAVSVGALVDVRR
jgi:hypothetical protein